MQHLWYSESLLASRLTVTRSSLENFRKNALGDGDTKKIGRTLFISESALKKLLAELGSEELDCSECLEKNGAQNGVVELVVTRVFPNPRLIQATTDTGELVLVAVPINNNFRPRMTVKAHAPAPLPAPQLYRLEGRCPRFPGRW
jgi:hypothetical protein